MRNTFGSSPTSFRHIVIVALVVIICLSTSGAQQPAAQTVPHLIKFEATLTDASGHPRAGSVGITFALYKDPDGGSPLWLETQNVQLDAKGHYSVQLGATKTDGVPLDLFVSGEAHWLGVRPEGQPEQTRVLLVSVPYALKAADADTIGGRPFSAFVLAASPDATGGDASASAPPPATVTGNGTANFLPLWTSTTNLGNSVLFQTGTGVTAKLGIGTQTPIASLDVKGTTNIQGMLKMPSVGLAKVTAGANSQPFALTASAFNSTTATAVAQTFQWKAEPSANNTTSPAGTLNLLFGSGAAGPTETGLKIAKNGQFTFAAGQTFPGAVTTVTAGGDLAGGGSGGNVTLSLNRTSTDSRYAQLAAANTFTQNQTVQGNLAVKRSDTTVNGTRLDVVNTSLAGSSYAIFAASAVNGGVSTAQYADGLGTGPLGTPGGYFGTFSGHPMGLFTGNQERVFIGANGLIGIPTKAPQALLNVNQGPSANTFLVGSTSKGLLLRDTGVSLDLESLGAPLYINNTQLQSLYLNPSGGTVAVGTTDVSSGGALTVSAGTTNLFGLHVFGAVEIDSGGLATTGSAVIGNDLHVGGSKNFRIDHPLDPENKYLKHASIESSEVLNLYTGNVTLDAAGEATVAFPAWFHAVNTDFRYQLTAVDAPGPNLYIAQKLKDGHFRIAGGKPGAEVSWQVTCRRNDPYMQAHPFVVEEDKPAQDVGYYQAPDLYGQPSARGIHSKEHMAELKKLKAETKPQQR